MAHSSLFSSVFRFFFSAIKCSRWPEILSDFVRFSAQTMPALRTLRADCRRRFPSASDIRRSHRRGAECRRDGRTWSNKPATIARPGSRRFQCDTKSKLVLLSLVSSLLAASLCWLRISLCLLRFSAYRECWLWSIGRYFIETTS